MKILCISDTHMSGMPLHQYPDADILVHAGDATFRGRIEEVKFFAKELSKHYKDSRHHKGYQQIIFVPGNHDFLFETQPRLAREIMAEYNIITLINEAHTYNGIKFWGSPTCPPFHNWAFYRNDIERYELWETIPNDIDILITHGPPKFMRDEVRGYMKIKYCGCGMLEQKVKQIRPKAHIFGHIHEGYGVTKDEHTLFVNAAIMDGRYKPENKPILIEINDTEANYIGNINVNFNINNY